MCKKICLIALILSVWTLSSALASELPTPLTQTAATDKPPLKTDPLFRHRLGPDLAYILGSDTTRVRNEGAFGAQYLFPKNTNGLNFGFVYQYGWNNSSHYALMGFSMNYYFWEKIPGAYFGGDVGVTDSSTSSPLSIFGEYFMNFKLGYEFTLSSQSTAGIEYRKSFRDTNPIVPIRDTDVYFNALVGFVRWTVF